MSEVDLRFGDCLAILRTLPDASIDAVVTDPPYGLADHKPAAVEAALVAWAGGDRERVPSGRGGFMGRDWDSFVPPPAVWDECLRVLKPGGHLLAFAGSRTVDLMGLSVRLAGFELRDSITWIYGQGFPKGKSQLKPGHEPIIVARKPLAGTVAATVLAYGTGALNIDGCRVETSAADARAMERCNSPRSGRMNTEKVGQLGTFERSNVTGALDTTQGRWPANVVLDEAAVAELDAQTGTLTSGANPTRRGADKGRQVLGEFTGQDECVPARGVDSGGASRFFYCAKAPAAERPKVDGQGHPTVKPLTLMRWLVRLVTPPGGVVLDPFAGSGTTLQAARDEGFASIGCESWDLAYRLARQRLGLPDEVPADPVLVEVAAAVSYDELGEVWGRHVGVWTDEHTAAVHARLAELGVAA